MAIKPRDTLRFQFQFGGLPEENSNAAKLSMVGNISVSYDIPYSPKTFSLAFLRNRVEHEHDENMKHAHRCKNVLRKRECEGIAKMSIESVRTWFSNVDVTGFDDAVSQALSTNMTTTMNHLDCRLMITPQHSDAIIL